MRPTKTGLGQDELVGGWGDWTVAVVADGLTDLDRSRIASLLRFREHDGYLVLDPVAPMHAVGPGGTEIVFDGLRIDLRGYPSGCPTASATALATGQGFPVRRVGDQTIWCDPTQRVEISVEPPLPADLMMNALRVTRVG